MRIGNDRIEVNTSDMSQTITGAPIWLGHICNFAIQVVFSGTPSGVWFLQASNDLGGRPEDPEVINWTLVKGSEQLITEAGDHMWNVQNCGYRWVRCVYIPTLGSGILESAVFNVKGA